MRHIEVMCRQTDEMNKRLQIDLKQKDIENERLINELKQSKIHVALLEEQTAQRELDLKQQIDAFKAEKFAKGSAPELTINIHNKNYNCLTFGSAQVQNSHEIKVMPQNFL